MNKSLLLFFLLSVCFSCVRLEKIEQYEDGSIKSRFKGDINSGSGEKVFYGREGGIIKKEFFINNQIDSSIYYFEGRDNLIKEIWSYNDSTVQVLKYDTKGLITKKGEVLKEDTNFKIGKWAYIDYRTEMDSVVEYLDVNNKSYANQSWLRTLKGDTVYGRGNYIEIHKKDTISVEEVLRVQFILIEPSLGIDSEIFIIIPKKDEELNDDYSNLFEIQRDTVYNMKNDGIARQGIPKEMPIKHIAEFGIQFDKPGKRRIKGALIEYLDIKSENANSSNSVNEMKKVIFFDKFIFVKDISSQN